MVQTWERTGGRDARVDSLEVEVNSTTRSEPGATSERGGGTERAGRTERRGRSETGGAVATWDRRLLSAPMTVRVLLSLVLVAGVGVLDAITGNEVSFSIFYLAPVSFAGAVISRRAGVVLAILGAVTWGYIDVSNGPAYSAVWIPYWNTAVRLGFFLVVNELIERLRRAHAGERALARTDTLTGIANRRVFVERAEWVIALSRRSGRSFNVAYLDLDGFKRVNDEHGHSAGDTLLTEVAKLITGGVRATDVVARLGGDEFGILMPDTDESQAQVTLERVAAAITDKVEARWGWRPRSAP